MRSVLSQVYGNATAVDDELVQILVGACLPACVSFFLFRLVQILVGAPSLLFCCTHIPPPNTHTYTHTIHPSTDGDDCSSNPARTTGLRRVRACLRVCIYSIYCYSMRRLISRCVRAPCVPAYAYGHSMRRLFREGCLLCLRACVYSYSMRRRSTGRSHPSPFAPFTCVLSHNT